MITLIPREKTNPNTEIFDISADGKVVGFCQLRHQPTKSEIMPDGFESHIYYEIDPEFRGKGYASEALGQLLKKARNIGMREVILTTVNENAASERVIRKNRGEFLEEKPTKNGLVAKKYTINLNG